MYSSEDLEKLWFLYKLEGQPRNLSIESFCTQQGVSYQALKTPKMTHFSGQNLECIGETLIMVPAAGFYTNSELGKNQVRLAYVLCKDDLQRAIMTLEKAIEQYNSLK